MPEKCVPWPRLRGRASTGAGAAGILERAATSVLRVVPRGGRPGASRPTGGWARGPGRLDGSVLPSAEAVPPGSGAVPAGDAIASRRLADGRAEPPFAYVDPSPSPVSPVSAEWSLPSLSVLKISTAWLRLA